MLKEYLNSFSHETLRSHFAECFPEGGLFSSNEIVANIIKTRFTKKAVAERTEQLSAEQKDVLTRILLFSLNGTEAGLLFSSLPKKKLKEIDGIIAYLTKSFLIFGKNGNHPMFSVLPEIIEHAGDALLSALAGSWKERRKPVTAAVDVPIWNDLTTFLAFCAKGTLKCTQRGFTTKRCCQEIMRNFQVKEDFSAAFNSNYFKIEDLPVRFRTIYHYGRERRLFDIRDDRFMITPIGETWIRLTEKEKIDDFLEFALGEYSHFNLELFFTLLNKIHCWKDMSWLLSLHYGFDAEGEKVSIRKTIKNYSEFPEIFRNLCAAGLISLGWEQKTGKPWIQTTKTGTAYFNENKLPETEAPLVSFTPDFEIIVPPETVNRKRFLLSRMCENIGYDQIYRLKLDRTHLFEMLDNGFDISETTRLLDEPAVPANVAACVNEWIAEYDRLSFSQPLILEVKLPKLLEELKSVTSVSELFLKEIPGYGFIIHQDCYEKTLSALKNAGYFPRKINGNHKDDEDLDTPKWHVFSVEKNTADVAEKKTAFLPLPDSAEEGTIKAESKYNAALKSLDEEEMVKAIKYAIITGQYITIDYAGDRKYTKKGIRKVKPLHISNELEKAEVEAEAGKESLRFLVTKIKRMAVLST